MIFDISFDRNSAGQIPAHFQNFEQSIKKSLKASLHHLSVWKLTSSILVTKIRESPNIGQVNSKTYHREQKIHLLSPRFSFVPYCIHLLIRHFLKRQDYYVKYFSENIRDILNMSLSLLWVSAFLHLFLPFILFICISGSDVLIIQGLRDFPSYAVNLSNWVFK